MVSRSPQAMRPSQTATEFTDAGSSPADFNSQINVTEGKMKKVIVTATIFLLLATNAYAVTLTQEITRVREYLYQDTAANSTYTDTQITEAINEGQNLLSNLLSLSANHENVIYTNGYLLTTGEAGLSLASGTTAVGLKRMIALSVVWPGTALSTAIPAIQVKPEEVPVRFNKGTTKDPTFFIANNYINIYPTNPGGTEYIIYVYLKAYTTLTSGSDTVTVQTRFLNLLTLAATYYVLQADNQQARAANVLKLITDFITIENTATINSNVIEHVQQGVK